MKSWVFINGVPTEYEKWPGYIDFPNGTYGYSDQFQPDPWSIVKLYSDFNPFWNSIDEEDVPNELKLALLMLKG